MNTELVDAIRTVGNLLLTNSTTGTHARNSSGSSVSWRSPAACQFCYMGATYIVSDKLNLSWIALDAACDGVIGRFTSGTDWDSASPRTRKRWANKLANYTGG